MKSVLALLAVCATVRSQWYINSTTYDQGQYGRAPYQNFTSRPDLHPAAVNVRQGYNASLSPGYFFLGYAGADAAFPSPQILDQHGELVWMSNNSAMVLGFRAQTYQNQSVLSYWQGEFFPIGYGKGVWNLLDTSYNLIRTVQAIGHNDSTTDLHEMQITSNDTFLVELWVPTQTDLTSIGGSPDGWTYDCIFQEIDAEGNILFEWHSLDHVPVSQTYFGLGADVGNSAENAFNYCHLNSIDKDDDGTYLVSLRGPSTIVKIGTNGQILWNLGGKRADFSPQVLAELPTSFLYQHDARLHNDSSTNPRYISLFDNNGSPGQVGGDPARGMLLVIDTSNMTVSLAEKYIASSGTFSASQGSVKIQDNGNAVVGWGSQPYYSEFAENGTLVYDVHFGASENLQSYRVWKGDWNALPETLPDVTVQNNTVFVSWNGATNVTSWMLMSGSDMDSLASVAQFNKTGFETSFALPASSQDAYIAVAAYSSSDEIIGTSEIMSLGFSGL